MFRLGVNIDHVATLRQARRVTYPDIVTAAAICEEAGAHGITIHLREDRRHIQDADVYALSRTLKTHMNLEMANHPDILAIALEIKPREVCIVPERREELTTEGGLDVAGQQAELVPMIEQLRAAQIAVSLFIDPVEAQLKAAAELGVPIVELHTGAYAEHQGAAQQKELERLRAAGALGHTLGLQINAGHGLTLENVSPILTIPHLNTLNIGHSIVSRAVFVGLAEATREMLAKLVEG